jgi:hypothetical protein
MTATDDWITFADSHMMPHEIIANCEGWPKGKQHISAKLLPRGVKVCARLDGPFKSREIESSGHREVSNSVIFTLYTRTCALPPELTLVPARRSFMDLRCKPLIFTHIQ